MTSKKFIEKRKKWYKFFSNNIYDKKRRLFVSTSNKTKHKIQDVAERFNCSKRTVMNNWKLYLNVDKVEFHKHRGVENTNAKVYDEDYEKSLVQEYIEFDKIGCADGITIQFPMSFFFYHSKLFGSESTKRRILEKYFLGYYAHNKTRHKWSKNLVTMSTDEVILNMIQKALTSKPKKTKLKELLPFGQIVEVDGCSEPWLPTSPIIEERCKKATIHAAMDHSGYMLCASIDWEETNKGYIKVFFDLFMQYGAPCEIRGDKRTSFQYRGLQDTELGAAINSAGIFLNCESYGQHKPNVEKSWGSIQPWLKKHLAIVGIRTYEQLFEYVNSGRLVIDYNAYFKKKIDLSKGNHFRKMFEHEVKATLVSSTNRTVQKGNFFKINNQYYYPNNAEKQRLVLNENKKHSTFKIYTDLLENKMFIKVSNQKAFLRIAHYSTDYLDRDRALNAADSDTEMIIYEQETVIRESEEKINLLQSMIYNSSDKELISKLEKLLATK